MIIPCIDLMDQKALEGDAPLAMLERFAAFPEIQVIDLDAAIGKGENSDIVELLATRARIRVGGGVRSVERAEKLIKQGAHRVIVGTSAFVNGDIHHEFLRSLADAIGIDRTVIALDSQNGKIAIKGWREQLAVSAIDVINRLEPYCSGFLCTYVDKEGMMQGTDLDWFRSLRKATGHEITAAGGITTLDDVRALQEINVHAALGMAIYTGRLDLQELAAMQAKA
jgi:phosphoribosylformimino-5-aminoimidazole carboxamide ribonucleotide (ProFAR) isomerase